MRTVDLEQGTEKWLEWRKDKITASDVAKICNKSPYGTPYSLWLEKKGITQAKPFNNNMQYGSMMEPFIRSYIEEKTGVGYIPVCVESEKYPFIAASLDGISFDNDLIEIKCCSREVFEKAQQGEVVEHYLIQVLAQLYCVPESSHCDVYFYFNNSNSGKVMDEDIAMVRVEKFACELMIDDIEKAIVDFWNSLLENKPPEPSKADYIHKEDEAFIIAEKNWIEAYEEFALAKKKEEVARRCLIQLANDANVIGNSVKLSKVYRSGTVDWKSLCQNYNISDDVVDLYRKDPIEYYKPTILP